MKTEFEAKILDVNVSEILKKLEELGAEKLAEKDMKRFVYDIEKTDVSCKSWIRLRHDGEKATLTLKEVQASTVDGTKEIEFEVGDFSVTNEFLQKIGFLPNGYQENKRVSFKLGNACIELDSWPKIPPYIEVEAGSVEEVEKVVKLLGFEMQDTVSITVGEVYQKYGLNIHDFKELKF